MIGSLIGLMVSFQVQALALGPDEFVAARQLTCVLAEESLGYLSDEDYAARTRSVLKPYEGGESDVIYAKALGYFDGLMFGLPEDDDPQINARLRTFLDSQACSGIARVGLSL